MKIAITLKIRGGRERDAQGKKAGKGPLVQWEKSATLGVSQDQTLIVVEVEESAFAFKGGVLRAEIPTGADGARKFATPLTP